MFDDIKVLEQNRYEDSRGFLQKVLTESQCNGHPVRGEIYVTSAFPGEVKGNHFHLLMGEWFSIIQGHANILLCSVKSERRRSFQVCSEKPCTIYVPAGIAHAVVNTGDNILICLAIAESEHNQKDVFPYSVWNPNS